MRARAQFRVLEARKHLVQKAHATGRVFEEAEGRLGTEREGPILEQIPQTGVCVSLRKRRSVLV